MKRCPHCAQTMPETEKRVRTCFDCKAPIRLHDKWTWGERSGVLTCIHRHCENPQSYDPAGPREPAPAPLFDGEVT
jgi:hypothetical protein